MANKTEIGSTEGFYSNVFLTAQRMTYSTKNWGNVFNINFPADALLCEYW